MQNQGYFREERLRTELGVDTASLVGGSSLIAVGVFV